MPPTTVTAADALRRLADLTAPGDAIYVQGGLGEPVALRDALSREPNFAEERVFTGLWIPGLNRFDYAALAATSRSEIFFLTAEQRASFSAGEAHLLPLSYTAIARHLERRPLGACLIRVSRPNRDGLCSLGPSVDFAPTVLERDIPVIAELDAGMPFVEGAPTVPLERFDTVVETDYPLPDYPAAAIGDDIHAVTRRVAALIPDGATLQFGIGGFQSALLAHLKDHKSLRIHSGMISDPVLALLDTAIDPAPDSITSGVALGTQPLYETVAADPRVRFAPVAITHGHDVLSRIDRFTAVNSVISVDLFGQANAEGLGTRQSGGTGGLSEFIRGAQSAPGGLPILALPATAKNGTVSRIVVQFAPGTPVAVPRSEAGIVVTEHGAADLRTLDLDARAQALIGLAAPAFRDTLASQWDALRRAM